MRLNTAIQQYKPDQEPIAESPTYDEPDGVPVPKRPDPPQQELTIRTNVGLLTIKAVASNPPGSLALPPTPLDEFFNTELDTSGSPAIAAGAARNSVHRQICGLKYGSRLPLDTNMKRVWQRRNTGSPHLYAMASALLSVPASKATIKWTLPALEQMLVNKCVDLKTINDVIVVKLNYAIIDKIH